MATLKEEVRDYASEIGLDLFGVASVEPFSRYLEQLKEREHLYKDRFGHRFDTWRRFADPKSVLADAKSLIVIGFFYLTNDERPDSLKGKIGRIVTYGHLGILKRAKLLQQFLEKRGYKVEIGAHRKEAAIRAGLGQVGKNTLLINEKFGTWVAYQCLITDAKMEFDATCQKDPCGDCHACLDSCPNGALYEPYKLNPQKCIACMLTGDYIPETDWSRLNGYILGCDICQDVCPKNKGITPKQEVESILPDWMGTAPALDRMLTLNERKFRRDIIVYIMKRASTDPLLRILARYKWIQRIFKLFASNNINNQKEILPETFINASSKLKAYQRNAILASGLCGEKRMVKNLNKFRNHPELGKYASWSVEQLEKDKRTFTGN
jgi:epoxyqueuosine reductase